MPLQDWSPERSLATIVDLLAEGAVEDLVDQYEQMPPGTRGERTVLERLLDHSRRIGAVTGVLEYRYVDADYRSEHAIYYGTTFRRYPSVAHRLHLFAERPEGGLDDDEDEIDFAALGYRGYVVLRPVPGAPAGRTMLPPDPDQARHVTCTTVDTVNLFGQPLAVRASPFMAQDGQVGICAHTSVWTVAYYHHLASGLGRTLPAGVAAAVPHGQGLARSAPAGGLSGGLAILQVKEALRAVGLPPIVHDLERLPKTVDQEGLVCRYLNSGLPVIVASEGAEHHTRVLVGYRPVLGDDGQQRAVFIAQDDAAAPYVEIADWRHDPVGPWRFVAVPLPDKIYRPAEDAEIVGRARIIDALTVSDNADAKALLGAASAGDLTFRTTGLLSNAYKARLHDRLPRTTAVAWRRLPMSRWIWVVEAQRRGLRDAGQPSVVAEAVVDATDHLHDQRVLALRVPGGSSRWYPDSDLSIDDDMEDAPAVRPLAPGLR